MGAREGHSLDGALVSEQVYLPGSIREELHDHKLVRIKHRVPSPPGMEPSSFYLVEDTITGERSTLASWWLGATSYSEMEVIAWASK